MPGANSSIAFKDFDSLVGIIEEWMARKDLRHQIPTFIWLCECELQIHAKFRMRDTTVTGTSVADQDYIDLPTDYVGGGLFNWTDSDAGPIRVTSWDRVTAIQKSGDTGASRVGVIHGSRLYVGPAPGADDYTLYYQAGTTHLSKSVQSNTILVEYPHALLYGALKHGSGYTGSPEIQKWTGLYNQGAEQARIQEWNARASHGPFHMRPDVAVR